jgi:hypothetical protein
MGKDGDLQDLLELEGRNGQFGVVRRRMNLIRA